MTQPSRSVGLDVPNDLDANCLRSVHVPRLPLRKLFATLGCMAAKLHEQQHMSRWLRAALRAPITVYRIGLGRLLGERFLLLHHTGRKTGKPRATVLEVVDHDRAHDTYYVAVGFGRNSDWFKNLQQAPSARIEVGARKLSVRAYPLDVEQGAARMCSYARRHPHAARMLAKLMGFAVDGSEADYAQLPKLGLQFVALEVA